MKNFRTVLGRFTNLELLDQGLCCRSGSICFWDYWICIRIHKFRVADPDTDPHTNCGSGSRRAKMAHKNIKKYRIFMFWSAGCSLLRAEGFSCSLGVLYGGLGISKLQFLIKKIKIKFPAVYFSNFRSSNPGSESGILIRNPHPQLEKMLDPDPYPDPY